MSGGADGFNEAYYGKAVTPSDILIKGTVKNPESSAPHRHGEEAAGP